MLAVKYNAKYFLCKMICATTLLNYYYYCFKQLSGLLLAALQIKSAQAGLVLPPTLPEKRP